jgi:predicted nuclease of restriction endonuclease-like (RecB) superfamily
MSKITIDNNYRTWLGEIKNQIKASQIKASLSVNSELIKLYWYIGEKIWEIQKNSTYGDGIIAQVANDLKNEFPEMTGFSRSNIFTMRQLYVLYFQNNTNVQQLVGLSDQNENVQQPVGLSKNIQSKNTIKTNAAQVVQHFNSDEIPALIVSIPWGHHTTILRKIKNLNEAIFYIQKTVENNWSRSVLEYQIETNLYQRQGKAITNFKNVLPAIQSDLANAILKDTNNNPTIGVLLCKNKDNYEVEFALKDIYKPIGVSEYRYTELPENIRQSLPTIEELTN